LSTSSMMPLLATCFMLISCLAYRQIWRRSSETQVDFQRTTRRYIPEPTLWDPQIVVCFSCSGLLKMYKTRDPLFRPWLTFPYILSVQEQVQKFGVLNIQNSS
jgi:hypothetical protein